MEFPPDLGLDDDTHFIDTALEFVAGRIVPSDSAVSSIDKDVLSWMLMSGDFFSADTVARLSTGGGSSTPTGLGQMQPPHLALPPGFAVQPRPSSRNSGAALSPLMVPTTDLLPQSPLPPTLVGIDAAGISATPVINGVTTSHNSTAVATGGNYTVPGSATNTVPPSVFANAGAALYSGFQRLAATFGMSAQSSTGSSGLSSGGFPSEVEARANEGLRDVPFPEGLVAQSQRRSKRSRDSAVTRDSEYVSRASRSQLLPDEAQSTSKVVTLEASARPRRTGERRAAARFSGTQRADPKRSSGRSITMGGSVAGGESSIGSIGIGSRRRGARSTVADSIDASADATMSAESFRGNQSDVVARLQDENAALRAQVRAMSVATYKDSSAHEAMRQAQLKRITEMVAAGAPDAQLREEILQYKDLHGDFGKDRWVALRHHLRCLKALLLPNQITKLTMWSVAQEDLAQQQAAAAAAAAVAAGGSNGTAAVDSPSTSNTPRIFPANALQLQGSMSSGGTGPSGVWARLSEYTEMTAEQQRRILGLRDSVRARRREFAELLSLLRELEERLTANFQGLELQMNLLMGQLSPRQIALFLDWMEQNQPMFKLVSSLATWPHGQPVGSVSGSSTTDTGVAAALVAPTPASQRGIVSGQANGSSGGGAATSSPVAARGSVNATRLGLPQGPLSL